MAVGALVVVFVELVALGQAGVVAGDAQAALAIAVFDSVVAPAGGEEVGVGALRPEQGIVAGAAFEEVGAGLAEQGVGVGATVEGVVAGVAFEVVGAALAVQHVVAGAAVEAIGLCITRYGFVARRSKEDLASRH